MAPVPAPTIGKRKRAAKDEGSTPTPPKTISIQIITGSYERVLHALTATFPPPQTVSSSSTPDVTFTDTFLFHAHSSSISSLAISPPTPSTPSQPTTKRILATGSTDERINLYHVISTAPVPSSTGFPTPKPLPYIANTPSTTSSTPALTAQNRELGSLLHHNSTVTSLSFPAPSKLLSAALDNTIAIARTRDWTVLSTLKAPAPKASNRPSGDTAAIGQTPSGITALAVHPSAKLAVSVGQGERSMRLWNLVTGKKAGVLTFEKRILEAVGESRYRGGEGRTVAWRGDGEAFVVGFERGAVVFGLDCTIRGVVRVQGTKVCQVRWVPGKAMVAVSTEDGRVLFYDTESVVEAEGPVAESAGEAAKHARVGPAPPQCRCVAQIGTVARGSRVKDFEIFELPSETSDNADAAVTDDDAPLVLVTGASDGSIKLWSFRLSELHATEDDAAVAAPKDEAEKADKAEKTEKSVRQIGTLMSTYETGRRITCLVGFVMDQPGTATAGTTGKKAKADETKTNTAAAKDGSDEDEEDEFGGFDE